MAAGAKAGRKFHDAYMPAQYATLLGGGFTVG